MSTVVCVSSSPIQSQNKLAYIRYFRYWIQSKFLYQFLPKGGPEGGRRSRHLKRKKEKKKALKGKKRPPWKKPQPYLCILVSMKQKIHSASNGYHRAKFSGLWNKSTVSNCDIFSVYLIWKYTEGNTSISNNFRERCFTTRIMPVKYLSTKAPTYPWMTSLHYVAFQCS